MTPRRYGPLAYVPITRRPKLTWPGGARVALWVNPNIEFFGLDDVMPGNLNERVPREHAGIPNVRNWAVRDYGNRVGIWRIMEVLSRYGIRASAALNSEVCDHHPEIIEEAGRLGWELIGHDQTTSGRSRHPLCLRLGQRRPALPVRDRAPGGMTANDRVTGAHLLFLSMRWGDDFSPDARPIEPRPTSDRSPRQRSGSPDV